jgi:hypothetical protein
LPVGKELGGFVQRQQAAGAERLEGGCGLAAARSRNSSMPGDVGMTDGAGRGIVGIAGDRRPARAVEFVNQFRLAVGHGPDGDVASAPRRAARAPSRVENFNTTTRDLGGDLSCAFY